MTHRSEEELRSIFVQQAIKAEHGANRETWRSCLWCSRVVGRYQKDAVNGLAEDLGKSTDTVYDRAHAYFIFEELCKHQRGAYRQIVFAARRSQYIYWSHFRALWDAKASYGLSTADVMDLLIDIIQAEGAISSRSLDAHVKSRYGVEKHWTYYAERARRDLAKILASKEVPRRIKRTMKKLAAQIDNYK